MNDKYEMIPEGELFRIKALKNFGSMCKGDKGGLIEREDNLSTTDDSWVYGNARVCDNAQVYGNARVCDNAWVYGNARVYGNAWVFGNAQVYGNAWVYGNAQVSGSAWVYGNAQVQFGTVTTELKQNSALWIACALNVFPVNGVYYLYKRVNKVKKGVYKACYDGKTEYRDGEETRISNPNEDVNVSCSSGIHVSTPFYYQGTGDILIAVSVKVEDVITCLEGKLRCRAVTTIGEVKEN